MKKREAAPEELSAELETLLLRTAHSFRKKCGQFFFIGS